MNASDIISEASTLLVDQTYARHTELQMLAWLNEGRLFAAVHRPDIYSTTEVQQLLPGARQLVPSAAARLTEITRNVCGPAITLTEREWLDRFNPSWLTGTRSRVVQHYTIDERDPQVYWVYPPAPPPTAVVIGYINGTTLHVTRVGEGQVGQGQVLYGDGIRDGTTITRTISGNGGVGRYGVSITHTPSTPTGEITAEGAEIQLIFVETPLPYEMESSLTSREALYHKAWVDYICYRAYSKSAEYAGDPTRAQAHGEAFTSALGLGRSIDLTHSPNLADMTGTPSRQRT